MRTVDFFFLAVELVQAADCSLVRQPSVGGQCMEEDVAA